MSMTFRLVAKTTSGRSYEVRHDDLPSLNVANGNAPAVYFLLGIYCDGPCGDLHDLTDARLRLEGMTETDLQEQVRPTTEDHAPGRAHAIYCGLPLDRLRHYREVLLKILRFGLARPGSWLAWD